MAARNQPQRVARDFSAAFDEMSHRTVCDCRLLAASYPVSDSFTIRRDVCAYGSRRLEFMGHADRIRRDPRVSYNRVVPKKVRHVRQYGGPRRMV